MEKAKAKMKRPAQVDVKARVGQAAGKGQVKAKETLPKKKPPL